ncbi:MAG: nucleotidyltransferase domain-containing protein, partial [Acidobacteriota bacterium]
TPSTTLSPRKLGKGPAKRVQSAGGCGKLGLAGMQRTSTESFKPPSANDPVLAEMVQRLVEVHHPLQIYLFGSAARGDAGPHSDYDILVIVPDDTPADLQKSRSGYRAVRDLGVPRDIFVSQARDFRAQLHLKASFPSTVVREGIVLYAG